MPLNKKNYGFPREIKITKENVTKIFRMTAYSIKDETAIGWYGMY